MASASDVPNRFDVVIAGQGYLLADQEQQKAVLGYSPIFVPRQDVQGDYGDNKQDFWLSFAQRDWSKGEQLKYARPNDEDGASRYWQGSKVDVHKPGQVTIRNEVSTSSVSGIVAVSANGDSIFAATSSNLYEGSGGGAPDTDRGAHGLGVAPSRFGLVGDRTDVYLSSSGGGVRKWNGASFSTFSATGSDSLAVLNNTLYGLDATNAKLWRYDTAGTATELFQWKQVDGGVRGGNAARIEAFGGKLAILWGDSPAPSGAELWIYDGTAPAVASQFSPNFYAYDLAVFAGQIFVSGVLLRDLQRYRGIPAVFFYAGGSVGKLWEANTYLDDTILNEIAPPIAALEGGIVWADPTTQKLMFYDSTAGGVSSVASVQARSGPAVLGTAGHSVTYANTATTASVFPGSSLATSATITTALADFDNSLTKLFRGIRVDWDDDSTDTGATVDIAYRVNDLDGSYTTLQTGAASGTEYLLSGITGRSISVKVTLNKSGSTFGPTLKRIAVRAVPVQPGFKLRTYVLALLGKDGKGELRLRNGESHPKDGVAMATDLQTAATSSTPFTISDALGSYTGIVENLELRQIGVAEYIAVVRCREV